MNRVELNRLLTEYFPNLADAYEEEIEWQEGDETGSHIVYGDVFTPYVAKCLERNDRKKLDEIFDFLEFLLAKQDSYIDEVVAFSVIESLEGLLKQNHEIVERMGGRARKLLEEF